MPEPEVSHLAYLLLLNLQWFFIGLSVILALYDFVEFFRTKLKRYISYGIGRLMFALMIGIIGWLLAKSPTQTIPWSPELVLWMVGLVGMGQAIIVRAWEIREKRKEDRRV